MNAEGKIEEGKREKRSWLGSREEKEREKEWERKEAEREMEDGEECSRRQRKKIRLLESIEEKKR